MLISFDTFYDTKHFSIFDSSSFITSQHVTFNLLVKMRFPLQRLEHLRLQLAHLLVHLGQRLRALLLVVLLSLFFQLPALTAVTQKYRNATKQHRAASQSVCVIHGCLCCCPFSSSYSCFVVFLAWKNARLSWKRFLYGLKKFFLQSEGKMLRESFFVLVSVLLLLNKKGKVPSLLKPVENRASFLFCKRNCVRNRFSSFK